MNPAAKKPDETTYSGRFAARLRMLREKAGLSVTATVEAINAEGWPIKSTTYYNWESAISEPPFDALPKLAKVLLQKSPRTLLPSE